MAFAETYRRQAALLVRALPFVAGEDCFALKGGTAINLFVRDMPRLSVDIDLTYVPIQPRPESLKAIEAALIRIAQRIRAGIPNAQVTEGRPGEEKALTKLFPRSDGVQIEIEVTPVMRGCIDGPEARTVSASVEEAFGFAEMPVLPFADLYGGKIVAALDRQHPRDLFDVRDLLAREGIDDKLRRAFIVYLLCHHRPMHEVLTARSKDITTLFARDFEGMPAEPVTLKELTDTRETLIETIVGKMPDAHRQFLISFERGAPNWGLLGLPAVAELPAVKWRQLHLDKLSKERRAALVADLEKVLGNKPFRDGP
jgi:predicted nucleotidyltransferase component of viral defense system